MCMLVIDICIYGLRACRMNIMGWKLHNTFSLEQATVNVHLVGLDIGAGHDKNIYRVLSIPAVCPSVGLNTWPHTCLTTRITHWRSYQ